MNECRWSESSERLEGRSLEEVGDGEANGDEQAAGAVDRGSAFRRRSGRASGVGGLGGAASGWGTPPVGPGTKVLLLPQGGEGEWLGPVQGGLTTGGV
jgi:hypothetical protein